MCHKNKSLHPLGVNMKPPTRPEHTYRRRTNWGRSPETKFPELTTINKLSQQDILEQFQRQSETYDKLVKRNLTVAYTDSPLTSLDEWTISKYTS
jgi:hypothetical protein